jgi:hypothetical protein
MEAWMITLMTQMGFSALFEWHDFLCFPSTEIPINSRYESNLPYLIYIRKANEHLKYQSYSPERIFLRGDTHTANSIFTLQRHPRSLHQSNVSFEIIF